MTIETTRRLATTELTQGVVITHPREVGEFRVESMSPDNTQFEGRQPDGTFRGETGMLIITTDLQTGDERRFIAALSCCWDVTAVPSEPGSVTARRFGYMAALSAAEHVLSTSPVVPTDVTIYCAPWSDGPSLRIYFHDAPDDVRAFSEAFGGTVSEEERSEGTQLYTQAVGAVAGIPFEAWALVRVGGAE